MLTVLLAAALAMPQDTVAADSTYATAALRALVEQAAARNAMPPASLRSYAARVETEFSMVQNERDGRESVYHLEQVASDFFWRSDGKVAQEVVGYRSQAAVPWFSALGLFGIPYLMPTLYANQLMVVRTRETLRADSAGRLVHPFAPGREGVYRFTGGDTVDVLELPARRIPIVRMHVVPVREPGRDSVFYEGDIDLDATRLHIVRMRGRFVQNAPRNLFRFVGRGTMHINLENGEYEEEYWLPREQRFDGEMTFRFSEAGASIRGVTRFVRVTPDDPRVVERLARADSATSDRITLAPRRRAGTLQRLGVRAGRTQCGRQGARVRSAGDAGCAGSRSPTFRHRYALFVARTPLQSSGACIHRSGPRLPP